MNFHSLLTRRRLVHKKNLLMFSENCVSLLTFYLGEVTFVYLKIQHDQSVEFWWYFGIFKVIMCSLLDLSGSRLWFSPELEPIFTCNIYTTCTGWRTMLVVPELEKEVDLLWEIRGSRKVRNCI